MMIEHSNLSFIDLYRFIISTNLFIGVFKQFRNKFGFDIGAT